MHKYKKFFVFVVLLGLVLPALNANAVSGDRYFVKSKSSFWKNTFGMRHEFEDGFSADLSGWQLKFAKMFGVEIEPVQLLQILPEENKTDVSAVRPKKGPARAKPTDQTPWGIEYVYNDPAITKTDGGLSVSVAILDTGIMKDHLDLKRRVAQCKDFTNLRVPVVDGKCDDKNGHGTHVSGIIAADGGEDSLGIYGVAPQASLWAYKVCDASGSCWADDIALALRVAVDGNANIINISLGSDSEIPLISNAIEYAKSKGVLVVVAAGNDGPFFGSIDYPAANEYAVSVGAFDKEYVVPDWSSRGINSKTTPFTKEAKDVEFAAPGVGVESAWKDGGYVVLSGTSMATPFISGLAAKLWQSSETNPAGAVRSLLQSLASDIWAEGDDDATGFGFPSVPVVIQ